MASINAAIEIISFPKAAEVQYSRRALVLLKDRLTPNGVLQLLENDIDSSDTAWHAILANSSGLPPIPAKSGTYFRAHYHLR